MNRVIGMEEVREKIKKAISLICDTVGSTLGPLGNNVLINGDNTAPFITNDGATIARNIESDDGAINAILEIIKESSLKTEQVVGDGTTTTLVLLKSIYENGLVELEKNNDAIKIRDSLYLGLEKIISKINEYKRIPSLEELLYVGTVSSGDLKIGKMILEVLEKMNSKDSIRIEESKNEETYYKIKKGYFLESDDISPLYFINHEEIKLEGASILLTRGYLNNLEIFANILNEIKKEDKKLIIFSTEISDYVKQELLTYNNVYIFEVPNYGSKKELILENLSSLCGANIKNVENDIFSFSDLGYIESCIVNKKEVILYSSNNIEDRIKFLNKLLISETSDYEKDFLKLEISKLTNGMAIIYVGGKTKTEKREKLMRFEDALCAVSSAYDGVVDGEGITFLKISEVIDNNILKYALKEPFRKILKNAYTDYEEIENKVLKEDKYYNLEDKKFYNLNDNKVLDPALVLIESIKNAVSIASILLTTNFLVINNKLKKEIDLL